MASPFRSKLDEVRELSHVNGRINQLTDDQLRKELGGRGLEVKGNTEVMKRRLKEHFRNKSGQHPTPKTECVDETTEDR